MYDRSASICEGFSILEWETVSQLFPKRKPLSNKITYRTTLIPSFAFLNGMKQPQATTSIAVAGIGLLHNSVFSSNYRPYGLLQRLGIASVLASSSPNSVAGPLASVALWNFASIYFAENPRKPFVNPGGTAQTRIDRVVAGRHRMLHPDWDPDGLLATLMTGVSMWIGSWCARNLRSKNECFLTGTSLFSMGYLASFAFPQRLPFSETFWTLSYTLGTSGLSLLKWTLTDWVSNELAKYSTGKSLLLVLETLGSHTVELFLISTSLDQWGVTAKVRSKVPGYGGQALAVIFKHGVILLSGWLLHLLGQRRFI